MGVQDRLYECRTQEKDEEVKNEINERYKRYHNFIVSLLKRSKQNYSASFFIQNQSNVRKIWEVIRRLINVYKKKSLPTSKLIYKNKERTYPHG